MFFPPPSSSDVSARLVTPVVWLLVLPWLPPFIRTVGSNFDFFWLLELIPFGVGNGRVVRSERSDTGAAGESGRRWDSFRNFTALPGLFTSNRLCSEPRDLPTCRPVGGQSPESCERNFPAFWTCWSFSIVFKCSARRIVTSSRVNLLPLLDKRLASTCSDVSIIYKKMHTLRGLQVHVNIYYISYWENGVSLPYEQYNCKCLTVMETVL